MGTINHIKTSTIGDTSDTNLIRPTDWNSIHAYTMQDAISLSGNTAGVLANVSSGTLYLAGGNNITLSQNANSVTVSCGASILSFFEPAPYFASNTATTTFGLGTLFVQPLMFDNNCSFKQANMIASASLPTASAANTATISFTTSARSFGFTNAYTIVGSNLVDLFMLSVGGGGSSTDIQTVVTTEASFVTSQFHTFALSATCGALTNTASVSSSVALSVVFPAITSATTSSVNAATTITTWDFGYSTWTSSASNVTNSSKTSGATMSISIASTWPATTAWASNKIVIFPFNTSFTAGLYWFGMNRKTNTSSSSSSANNNVSANQSYSSAINASNLTFTGQLTYVGFTNSVASSLAYMGANTAASLAPSPGHGTFSATYASNTTYYNNAGQASGEIALSDINTNVSLWKPWIQFGNNYRF